ncbi:sensor histidine kinase [Kibdelosporangium persicum]|uniref:histidine kinase n=1 Tax=Kibdelosporangium persicum TaxID=2698649 RepID=A0ABX2EXU3_9PSEU|nr:sensor histidine kinase [Kibdelosporangium persicum]NRN63542.1 Integral membrane sensor signal transduction histidine kinase [Kibdelosporangium persicum]
MDETASRPFLIGGLTREQQYVCDSAFAFVYTLLALIPVVLRDAAQAVPEWLAAVLVAGSTLPIAVRRRWPRPVFGTVLALSTLCLTLDLLDTFFVAPAATVYILALTERRPRWEPTLTLGLLSSLGLFMVVLISPISTRWSTAGQLLIGAAILGVTWTVGRAIRDRRAYLARSTDRAVTEERLRIARELHDVVAHSMGLIVVKAGVTNHLVDVQPRQAREALHVIETTGRDALTEMRHMLGVLRTGGSQVEFAPAPQPGGLAELADRAALAGVRVTMKTHGLERLSEGIGLSVYRIVQEALTNVVKHAAPAACRIIVENKEREVRIEVIDDGSGGNIPARQPGHGLIGIRERVTMYDGTFEAGPRPQGGFRVYATLPYGETP